MLRALALELATSFWSGQVRSGSGWIRGRDEIRKSRGIGGSVCLIGHGGRRRMAAAHLLRETGHPSLAQGRWSDGAHCWDPLAVLCGPTVSQGVVAQLCESIPGPTSAFRWLPLPTPSKGGQRAFRAPERNRRSTFSFGHP